LAIGLFLFDVMLLVSVILSLVVLPPIKQRVLASVQKVALFFKKAAVF
jgi:hypothetical protein